MCRAPKEDLFKYMSPGYRLTLNLKRIIVLAMIVTFSMPTYSNSEVDFDELNGSDLVTGIGARAIGLGGAFVSIADDASATFWNPAGLTNMRNNQLLLSADLLDDFSASSLVFKPSSWGLEKVNFTVALSYINRLRIKGDSGDGTWSGYSSYLLDLAMIDVEKDFSGSIDSRTYDTRVSLSFIHPKYKNLSMGLNLIHLC